MAVKFVRKEYILRFEVAGEKSEDGVSSPNIKNHILFPFFLKKKKITLVFNLPKLLLRIRLRK